MVQFFFHNYEMEGARSVVCVRGQQDYQKQLWAFSIRGSLYWKNKTMNTLIIHVPECHLKIKQDMLFAKNTDSFTFGKKHNVFICLSTNSHIFHWYYNTSYTFFINRFYSNQVTTTNKGYRTASYTIELRDDGKYQFILPAEQVINTTWHCDKCYNYITCN